MSEYLITGIAITVVASVLAGGCAGLAKGIYGIHSGTTFRVLAVCENIWVIFVIGTQASQVLFAYNAVGLKDAALTGVVFLLMLPSLIWLYVQSDLAAAKLGERWSDPMD